MGRVVFVLCAFMSTQIAFSQAWRGVDVSFLPEMEGDDRCQCAPDWVTSQGDKSTEGSTWENAALFDFDWAALPAWVAFSAP